LKEWFHKRCGMLRGYEKLALNDGWRLSFIRSFWLSASDMNFSPHVPMPLAFCIGLLLS
jgi:hypothetical protein